MSDSTIYNLLADGAVRGYRIVPGYEWPGYAGPNDWTQRAACVPGKAYTLSIVTDVAGEVCFGFYLKDGSCVRPNGYEEFAAGESVVRTLTAPEGAEYVAASWAVGNRRPMVVEGTEPAAWAPAEGETLAGGGASMSANLLAGVTPTLVSGTTESDGVWHNAGRTSTDGHKDWLVWDLAGQPALATNQTFHAGLSVKGATAHSGHLYPTIGYKDAAGHKNWAVPAPLFVGASWGRAEATIVIPSGMTPFAFYVAAYGTCPETWMAAPTLSLGSPVPLATSAHTPYATQDHVMVTYATKASLKVTDDSVKAEVSARAQTDRNVADLSSRLTQTANSLTSEISDRRTAITTVTGLANAAQSTADSASEQTVELSSRLDQSTTDITATIESKVQTVQQGVDDNASDVKNLNDRLSDEIRTRKSFMRFSEESSDPTLTLGQTDSPAQVKLTNKQLQFLYMAAVVAYISGNALLIRNATILQQLVLGGFAFVPRENGNLSLKWVG